MLSSNLPPEAQIEALLARIKENPHSADDLFALGNLAYQIGDLFNIDSAINLWSRAFRLKPEWPVTNPEWAVVLRSMSNAILQKDKTRLPEAMNLIGSMLDIERGASKGHPLGRFNFRFLSNCNVPQHLGHFCLELDLLIKMQQLGWTEKFHPILLVAEKACNSHLLTYWERYIEVIRDPLHVEQMLKLRDGMRFETHFARMPDKSVKSLGAASSEVQKEWFRQGRSPLLTLTDADNERGWETLKKMGVPPSSWFVALHVREPGFYNEDPNSQTSRFRNANIKHYTQAIEHIAAAGGWIIRIGDASMQPIEYLPNTIDYARSDQKSEWMDIFLCARSKFFLGSTSGITHLANIFGTPCALANWCSSTLPCFPTDLFIQKIPYSRTLNRALTFAELMSPPYVLELDGKLAEMGFEPQDNSSEDIVELVKEMLGTLDGSISYSNEDLDLQAKFRSAMDSPYSNKSGCRIGRHFLKQYSHLLPSL